MFLKEFDFGFKTLRLISIIIALIGLLFVFASSFIGVFSIRLATIGLLIYSIINFNFTSVFSFDKVKILSIIGVICSIVVFIYPQLAMFLIGIGLLIYAIPLIINYIKKKDFSDIFSIGIAILALSFGIYCILNGTAAIGTIVKLLGIIFVIAGCILFYRSIDLEKSTNNFMNDINIGVDEFRYRHAEEVDED